jgi:hypothetical protein
VGRAASGRSRRATSGSRTGDRARTRRADPPDPDPGPRRPRGALPQGRDAAGPGDQQGRDRGRLGESPGSPAWHDVRVALGVGRGRPIRGAPRRRALEGRRRPRNPPMRRARRSPPRSTRSTTSARPPTTGASSRPGRCTGSSATPAGW